MSESISAPTRSAGELSCALLLAIIRSEETSHHDAFLLFDEIRRLDRTPDECFGVLASVAANIIRGLGINHDIDVVTMLKNLIATGELG